MFSLRCAYIVAIVFASTAANQLLNQLSRPATPVLVKSLTAYPGPIPEEGPVILEDPVTRGGMFGEDHRKDMTLR